MVKTTPKHFYLYDLERAIATGSVTKRLLATAGLAVTQGNWFPGLCRTTWNIA